MYTDSVSYLQYELELRVNMRTNRRVRNLSIELSPERVVIKGEATSYYVKQLAQHGVREILPRVMLDNVINVDYSILAPLGAA